MVFVLLEYHRSFCHRQQVLPGKGFRQRIQHLVHSLYGILVHGQQRRQPGTDGYLIVLKMDGKEFVQVGGG